jgi:sarcosine oxidase gamma subunit
MAMATLLSADDARRIAADHAAAKGWPFSEPVHVRRRRSVPWFGPWRWVVLSNADSRGGNVWVEIDARTGAVLASGFNPR